MIGIIVFWCRGQANVEAEVGVVAAELNHEELLGEDGNSRITAEISHQCLASLVGQFLGPDLDMLRPAGLLVVPLFTEAPNGMAGFQSRARFLVGLDNEHDARLKLS
ncbi:hypothetical protein PG994_003591 [Apiospora phragmitis]|uniref:Uncharacterized protein n=1 Tax=Apiospora phragmitis TaxID=2905665 RepID=A0ABR1VYL5_9PEZI